MNTQSLHGYIKYSQCHLVGYNEINETFEMALVEYYIRTAIASAIAPTVYKFGDENRDKGTHIHLKQVKK